MDLEKWELEFMKVSLLEHQFCNLDPDINSSLRTSSLVIPQFPKRTKLFCKASSCTKVASYPFNFFFSPLFYRITFLYDTSNGQVNDYLSRHQINLACHDVILMKDVPGPSSPFFASGHHFWCARPENGLMLFPLKSASPIV